MFWIFIEFQRNEFNWKFDYVAQVLSKRDESPALASSANFEFYEKQPSLCIARMFFLSKLQVTETKPVFSAVLF